MKNFYANECKNWTVLCEKKYFLLFVFTLTISVGLLAVIFWEAINNDFPFMCYTEFIRFIGLSHISSSVLTYF